MRLERLLLHMAVAWAGGLAVDRAVVADTWWAAGLAVAVAAVLAAWLIWSVTLDVRSGRVTR